jgi:hypothetical protein
MQPPCLAQEDCRDEEGDTVALHKERMMMASPQVLNVGSYAPTDQPVIHVCTFDDATGDLTVRSSFAGVIYRSGV